MSEIVRIAKAVASNQLARLAPAVYVRLTGQTGRGSEAESAADIAAYAHRCYDEYFDKLGIARPAIEGFLDGKSLLEYGPGDLPAVAALMIAGGAAQVRCVDRFPLVRLSPKNVEAMQALRPGLSLQARQRLDGVFADPRHPEAGLRAGCIDYLVRPGGTSGLRDEIDLVFSRAVLEHVDDLEASLADMVAAMKPGALAIHLVDLRSHGLHRGNRLDFLAWSQPTWQLMYSAKGFPNRWRVDRYRELLARLPVDVLRLEPTERASPAEVAQVRPMLAEPFRALDDEDLAWLGFWLVFRRRAD